MKRAPGQIDELISDTLGTLGRARCPAPAETSQEPARKQLLVVGRERVAEVVRGLVKRFGTQVLHLPATDLSAEAARRSDARGLIVDGHCWERDDIPAVFLSQWHQQKRPFIILLQATQLAERGVWLESGALDVFTSPAPTRRLTERLMEAATGRRTPTRREGVSISASVTMQGRSAAATVLEFSPEDLLLSSTMAIPRGRIAQVKLSSDLTVYARSLFCRASGLFVSGLRILAVTRSENTDLERLAASVDVKPEK